MFKHRRVVLGLKGLVVFNILILRVVLAWMRALKMAASDKYYSDSNSFHAPCAKKLTETGSSPSLD
jgi:hypothetical protein